MFSETQSRESSQPPKNSTDLARSRKNTTLSSFFPPPVRKWGYQCDTLKPPYPINTVVLVLFIIPCNLTAAGADLQPGTAHILLIGA